MAREEVLLTESIRGTLDLAHKAVVQLFEAEERTTLQNVDEDTAQGEAKSIISFYVAKAFRDMGMLAERLGLPQYASELATERTEGGADFGRSEHTKHDFLPHVPMLSRAREHFASLSTLTNASAITSQDILRTLLENSALVIVQKGVNPSKESDVRNAMLEVLQLAFRDAKREVVVEKHIKNYRADIGVPSLRALIEYKYIAKKSDMKLCLDGIYADMKGYGRHDDWTTFYAVFYMTEAFYHQKDLEHEFSLVGADASWTPILVQGPRAKAAAT